MSYNFAIHKSDAEEMLENASDTMPHTMKIALKIIIEMANEGIKISEELSKVYEQASMYEEQRNVLAEELYSQIRSCINCPTYDFCTIKNNPSEEVCYEKLIEWVEKETE